MNEELNIMLERVRCLYQKYGIKSITMDDVARELGISKKTLYQYVTDKTDLVFKVFQQDMDNRRCEFEKLYSEERNAVEELIDVHKFVFKRMKEFNPSTDYDMRKYYPDLYRQIQEERYKKMYEKVIENIRKGKRQGLYRSELNEEVIAKLTVMRSDISGGVDSYSTNELLSSEFFTEVIIYHIRGIANENGIKILDENIDKLLHPGKE